MAPNPANVTLYGRLSWPVWTLDEAVARNAKSEYPAADPSSVTAEFNLLLEQAQLDKFKNHVKTVFLPDCIQREAAGEKRNALNPKQVEQIIDVLDSDWEDQPPYIPLKPMHEKTKPMAPEALVSLKVKGPRGADIELKAIVNSEDELAVPDPDLLAYPVVKPLRSTVHSMYGGCYVAATINLYTFVSGKKPGFSASANTAVFKADGDRFGGGVSIDTDEIFLD